MARVAFEHAGKVYEDGTRALADFNLEIADGEFMVLVGPSGCGKTTALRMVAGLEAISEGAIRIGDKVVNALEPRKRDLAMVFQNYALYPHMSVYRNIGFGLKLRKTPPSEIRRRVGEIARVLGIVELLDKKPRQLSGGQRQRVAMGRAIIRDPQAFLMDEPLSNLDAKLRVQMRAEIARIQREVNATTIYVTHDQVEAMTMGDRVAVLRKGVLQQVATPQVLYGSPTNLFVASFIGSPAMNLVQARLEQRDDGLVCRLGDQALALPEQVVAARPELGAHVGKTIALGIRPEHLHDAGLTDGAAPGRKLRGRVVTTELLGSELLAHLEVAVAPVVTEEVLEVAEDVDRALSEDLRAEAHGQRSIFVGRFDARSTVLVGDEVEATVDTDRLHFFELDTELALGAVTVGRPGDPAAKD
jgi:multiple sugar transport system ATP-binding protein